MFKDVGIDFFFQVDGGRVWAGSGGGGGRVAMKKFETVFVDNGSFNGWSSVFNVQVHKPDSCG